VSVDTYARKADYSGYRRMQSDGVEILIASTLLSQAERVRLDLRRFLLFRWLSVVADLRGHEACGRHH
jgi:hypothetical protein